MAEWHLNDALSYAVFQRIHDEHLGLVMCAQMLDHVKTEKTIRGSTLLSQ